MYIEIFIIGGIILFVLFYTGQINRNKFFNDNHAYFSKLKEEDYDFLVKVKYGEGVNADILFNKRIKNAVMVGAVVLIVTLGEASYLTVLLSLGVGVFIFKSGYSSLKRYYKAHLNQVNTMLPYYLKSLEILIQHYTVPVAIGKSLNDAPGIFKDGLQELVNAINAGDDSIQPYMDFAKKYPVRDSMRMMRLLYRLSLGKQERKQEQLVTFSHSISNLQQKARESKYKARLDKMEGKTMKMLMVTGAGVMGLLLLSVFMLMGM
ncbi:MAG: hypothetical protein IJ574_05790 [Bacilli bacterium]|nr:hypothetical protein [Bacilli bacterium]